MSRPGFEGLIDEAGCEAVPLKDPLDRGGWFSEGLYPVLAPGADRLYGYVDPSGRFAIPPRFISAEPFADGAALVRDRDGCVAIDRRGTCLLRETALQGLRAIWLHDGMLEVERDFDLDDDRCGYMDLSGRLVVPPRFEPLECDLFTEGLAGVPLAGPTSQGYGYVDREGRTAIPPRFADAGRFAGGLAPVKIGEAWGFIDRHGTVVIPPRYGGAQPFDHGLALVFSLDGEAGYVDARGVAVWPRPRPALQGTQLARRTVADSRDWRWGGPEEHGERVVRGQAEAEKLWEILGRGWRRDGWKPPPTAGLDFVLVAQGRQPRHYNSRIAITDVVRAERAIVVRYDEARVDVLPRRVRWHDITTKAGEIPNCFQVVAVPRQSLPYVFERRDLDATVARPRPPPR